MNIKILGTGCPKCEKLEKLTKQAASELNVSATFEKIKQLDEILEYGIAFTPGLVINGEVKIAGKIPSLEQIKTWISETV